MEARGSPNVDQNPNISWMFRDPLPESPPGGFGEGSGWIWGGIWEGFGGVQMDTKMKEFRGHFVTTSQEPPGFPRPLQP